MSKPNDGNVASEKQQPATRVEFESISGLLKKETSIAGEAKDFPIHIDTDIEDSSDEDVLESHKPVEFMLTEHRKARNRERLERKKRALDIRQQRRRYMEKREYFLRMENIKK